MIDNTSMMFIASSKNLIFSGAPASLTNNNVEAEYYFVMRNLSMYSRVNQAIHTVSMKAKVGFSNGLPFASFQVYIYI